MNNASRPQGQGLPRGKAPPSSHGRAALAWAAVWFTLVQLVLTLTMDHADVELRDPVWGRKLALLRQRLAQEPDRPLLLVLGSSRTALGLRPEFASLPTVAGERPIVFNFGISGAGPIQELLFLRRLLAEGIRPERILIEIHPCLLHEEVSFGELTALAPTRLDWHDLPVMGEYVYDRPDLYRRWWRARLTACWSHRVTIQMRWLPRWLDPKCQFDLRALNRLNVDGWTPTELSTVTRELYEQLARDAVRVYEPAFADFHITERPSRAIDQMLALCRAEGIEPALFLMPEASQFRTGYSADARQQIDDYLTDVSHRHGVPVFDLTYASPDASFADSHHMLPAGAEQFSRRFGRDVLRPLLTDGQVVPVSLEEEIAEGR
ncbi:MAG TPA: hypothetical protein VJ783_15885 [Pirellulales bacterium]|nr:hypothetical protein [Pirellulales bacterium]